MTHPTTLLCSGKTKSVYYSDQPGELVLEFRDDVTAFNRIKHEQLENKGYINKQFNAFIMDKLHDAGIKTHYLRSIDKTKAVVRQLEMIPVECVVRNYAAGSLCKRYGLSNGQALTPAVFEFFYKDDALGDPMINESHILTFSWASQCEIDEMKAVTFQVNDVLFKLFQSAGIQLVDYKLEFGRFEGQLLLGDEFTPDNCRLWDIETGTIYDKDRFRQDLGGVTEHYAAVAERIGVIL